MEHTGQDGPLLLALLLNNNNNNPANVPGNNTNPQVLNPPAGDILAIRPQDQMFELTKEGAANILGCRQKAFLGHRGNLPGHTKSQGTVPKRLTQMSLSQEISSTPKQVPDTVSNKAQTSALTKEQRAFWDEHGYLVLQDMLDRDQLSEMTADVNDIADSLTNDRVNVKTHPVVHGQRLDFEANGRVMVLLTESKSMSKLLLDAEIDHETNIDAFDANLEPLQRIHRLGTGIHRVLPNFRSATFSASNQQIAQSLGFSDPRVTQSLIITKAAANGARVIPHQDGCSSFTDPPSCVTFWYALEDSTVENGCLKVSPGSHRTQPIAQRCCRDDTGRPQFRSLDVPLYMQSTEPTHKAKPYKFERTEEFQNLEVKAGTLILMHGNLLHASGPNHSSRSRIAFNFGVVEGGLKWLPDNYLQPYDGETEFEKLAPLS